MPGRNGQLERLCQTDRKREKKKKTGVKRCPVLPCLACLLKHHVNDRAEYRAVPVCDEDEDREKEGKDRETKQ
jgi:hypothetical protein